MKGWPLISLILAITIGFQISAYVTQEESWRQLTGFSSLAAGEASKERCRRHYESECTASIIFLPKAVPAAELDEVSPMKFEQAVKKTISYTF